MPISPVVTSRVLESKIRVAVFIALESERAEVLSFMNTDGE